MCLRLGCVIIVLGLGGFVVGLMKYAFTGFPFGGGEVWIAEGRHRATLIMVPAAVVVLVGAAIAWSGWRNVRSRTDEPSEARSAGAPPGAIPRSPSA